MAKSKRTQEDRWSSLCERRRRSRSIGGSTATARTTKPRTAWRSELARRIGVKPSVISRLLDGKGRNVQLDTVADVADALDVLHRDAGPQPKGKRARHAPIEVLAA